MVYIYKKTIGNKPYYYLRVSERKGKKIIVKDIAYLGSSIDKTKSSLANLTKYKGKIRKAYKTIHNFLESNHYLEKVMEKKLKHDPYLGKKLPEVEACKLHYNNVFLKNDEATKNEILKNFVIEFAFNTASIEGNTITLKEARNLLEEGITPKNKTLREIYDLQNTEKMFFDLLAKKEELGHDLIIGVHSGLMENIDARRGYRTSDVRVIRANFESTPAPYVKTDMEILLKWYFSNKEKIHPVVLASLFHHKFEKIHPFMDGNGRTGRLLLNYILMKRYYPPLIIHRKFRQNYLEALREADKAELTKFSKDIYAKLIQFTIDEMKDYYWGLFL